MYEPKFRFEKESEGNSTKISLKRLALKLQSRNGNVFMSEIDAALMY